MEVMQIQGYTPELFKETLRGIVRDELKAIKPKERKVPEELMTRKEVAEYFKIDLSTLHHWTKAGRLKAKGIGYRVYYLRKDVEAALKDI